MSHEGRTAATTTCEAKFPILDSFEIVAAPYLMVQATFARRMDVVDDRKAIGLKRSGRHFPHRHSFAYGHTTIVVHCWRCDARHQLSATYIYQLPHKSENRLLNYAIGGWQISGAMFRHSGIPFSFIDGAEISNLTGNNPAGSTILLEPEFAQRNFSHVAACAINPCFGLAGTGSSAPSVISQVPNFIATVCRNAYRGPGFLGGGRRVRKLFHLNERMSLQLSLNAYNRLNHANYGTPFANDVLSFFGSVVVMAQPPTSPYGAFAAAATDMRMAQLQARLLF